ncbi:MAG: hypothetical protein LBI28_00005, partial [Treponema sp.]|nr:hypothetical protein [Treponema sp.]
SQTPASFSDLIGTWKRNNYGNTLTFTANTLKSSSQDYTWDFVSASSGSFRIRSEYNSGTNINISLTNGNMIISGDSGSGEDNWNGTWVKQVPAGQTQSAAQQAQTTNSEQSATSSADLSGGIVEWARGRYPDNVVLNANSITNGRDINITGVRTDVQSPLSGHPNLKWAYIYAGDKKYGVVWDRTTYDRSAHNGIELGMGSEARSAFDFYSGSDKDSIFNDIAREAPGIKVVKQ